MLFVLVPNGKSPSTDRVGRTWALGVSLNKNKTYTAHHLQAFCAKRQVLFLFLFGFFLFSFDSGLISFMHIHSSPAENTFLDWARNMQHPSPTRVCLLVTAPGFASEELWIFPPAPQCSGPCGVGCWKMKQAQLPSRFQKWHRTSKMTFSASCSYNSTWQWIICNAVSLSK